MKFQKQLKNVTVWNHHYLPYQKLKRKLRTFFSPPPSPSPSNLNVESTRPHLTTSDSSNGGIDYLEILDNEIKKVNTFILDEKLPIVLNRFEDLKSKFKSIDFSSPFSVYLSVGLMTPQQILQQKEEEEIKFQQLQEEYGGGGGKNSDSSDSSNIKEGGVSNTLDQSSSSLYFYSEQQQQKPGQSSIEVDTITAFQIAFEDILKQLAEIDNFSQLNIQAIQKLLNTYSKKKTKHLISDMKRRKVSQTELTLPKMVNLEINNNNNTLSPNTAPTTPTTPTNHQENQINSIKKEVDNYFKEKVELLELYHHTQIKKLTLEIELEYQTICQTNVYLLNNNYYDILTVKEKELSNKVGLLCRNVVNNNIVFVKSIIEEIEVIMKELKLDDINNTMWLETIHSCIHKSCYLGNVDMVELLFNTFSSIVNIRYCDEKNKQFIHIAAENGRYQVMEFLIENGADIECLDFISRRPLHLSAKTGNYDCSNLLLQKGAKQDVLDREGCTPLYLACRQPQPQKQQGNIISGNSVVDLLLLSGSPIGLRGPYGRHIIHEAASKGNVSNIVSILKVDPESANSVDSFGRTPLFESVKHGQLDAISTLLDKNAQIIDVFDDDKRTLLHEAAANGQLDSMHLLINNIVNTLSRDNIAKFVNQQDDDGWSPLHDACYLNYIQCVKCLLENKSNPNLLDKGEWSPIVHSLYRGNIQAAITIIEFIKKNPELFQESLSTVSTPTSLKDSKGGSSSSVLSPPKFDLITGAPTTTSSNSMRLSSNQISPPPPQQVTVSVTSVIENSGSNNNSSNSPISSSNNNTPSSSSPSTSKKILKSLMSTVTFRISVGTTFKTGHRVGIVGNRKAIGSWNPSAALMLKEVDNIGSSGWIGKVQVPVNVQLEYKYVIFEGSRLDTWEALPENRKFMPQEEEEFVDDGVFGQILTDLEENGDEQQIIQQQQQQSSIFMERGWLVADTQIRIRFGETSATDLQRKIIQPISLYNGKEQAGKILVSLRDRFSNIQPGTTVTQVNLPLTKDHSVQFQTNQLKSKSYHSIQFDIYRRGMSSVLIGRAIVLVSELKSLNPYKKVLPIINSSLLAVGELYFFPLIVSPFTHPKISDVLSNTYWKSTLLIGHRGGGAENARNVGKYKRTHIKENTILSFVTAASLGAQYIEFDVQLSRDHVPVIYHDFEILGQDGIKIPINKINLEQFKTLQQEKNNNLKKNNHHGNDHDEDNSNIKNNSSSGINNNNVNGLSKTLPSLKSLRGRSKSMQDIFNDIGTSSSTSNILANLRNSGIINLNTGGSVVNQPLSQSTASTSSLSNSPPSQPISDSMTTLEETFKNVQIQTGFNIEIKYPNQEKENEIQMHNMNRNAYVDIILKTVFEHAGNRSVMFSSFDADICLLVSLKQPKYPVFFLNNAGFTQHSDPRANSISEAIRFSKSAHLLGIVTNSKILCEAPPIIGQVKSAGLMLCSWGSENNDPALVDLQEQLGCDGVISDHIAYISKHNFTLNNNIISSSPTK